jgi:hypothetical protein
MEVLSYNIKIYGIKYKPNINPMYTVDGLQINLYYQNSTRVGNFRVALLKEGERWGRTFKSVIKEPTVAFFDTSVTTFPLDEYPSGQYVASYTAKILLKHDDDYGLLLDADVPEWSLTASDMYDIKQWLRTQLNK